MSVRIYWNASTEDDIYSYKIQRSTTGAVGEYSLLATVIHDLEGANYNGTNFFYDDSTGQSTYWYRLIAVDTGANESSPSPPFQATSSEVPSYNVVGVDVFVKDDSTSPDPIEDVNVGVFDSETLAPLAFGLTDEEGRAALILMGSEEGIEYEVRFFKSGVIFENPFSLTVLAPLPEGETNDFDVSGTLTSLPVSSDPRCCKCTGRFMNLDNTPARNTSIRVLAKADLRNPKVVDGNMISSEVFESKTDSNGKVSFNLVRGGEYYVVFGGEEDIAWPITVPDRTSMNLVDLIHPYPADAIWEDDTITMSVDEDLEVGLTIRFTDYQEKSSSLTSYVVVESSDDSIVTAELGADGLSLSGVAAGTAIITVKVIDDYEPSFIPDPSGSSLPTTLTVTVE